MCQFGKSTPKNKSFEMENILRIVSAVRMHLRMLMVPKLDKQTLETGSLKLKASSKAHEIRVKQLRNSG